MKLHHSRAIETRRLYNFEYMSKAISPYSLRPRSLKFLKSLAARVWAAHGSRRVPSITVVKGAPWSYCRGRSEIVLATGHNTHGNFPHNTVEVLLHELVHALGHGTHGAGFVRRYFNLLVEYGKCERGALTIDAALFKLKT